MFLATPLALSRMFRHVAVVAAERCVDELAIIFYSGSHNCPTGTVQVCSLGTRPSKNRKGGSGKRGSVHCGMLGILLIVEPSVASRAFWRTRRPQKRSNLTRLVLQRSKTKQNAKTCLVWLAFLINAHQNANQKPIGSAPAYRAQCTLPPQPIYQTRLFDFSRVWFRDYQV